MRLSPWMLAARIGRRFPLFALSGWRAADHGGASRRLAGAWSGDLATTWPTLVLCLLAVPLLMCAAHLAIGLVNWLATLLVQPRPLPRMDFQGGIPPEHRTMVVVPTMLSSAEAVAELLEGLEVRYLANRDDNLHFALLTDFEDAAQEIMPGDEELVRLAREGIEQLNQKYAQHRTDIFYPLPSPAALERPGQGLDGLRTQARQAGGVQRPAARTGRDRFAEIVGDTAMLREVRYVITLDTDTQLPRDSARDMVGAMAHPLNRPVFDPKRGRVVAGYGILQPRVGVSLPSARRSWFVRLFAGDAGIDPYTRVVSDRLPGPVRRRLVRRQGHLRCGRLRAVLRRLPRKYHPEPRSAGKRATPARRC